MSAAVLGLLYNNGLQKTMGNHGILLKHIGGWGMKQSLAAIAILLVILISGCGETKYAQVSDVKSDTLPKSMDFEDFKIKLVGFSVAEFEDEVGYTTVVDFRLNFERYLSERDIEWIIKDDLDCFVFIEGKDGKIDLSQSSGMENLIEPCYSIYGNFVYYDFGLQTQGRYSVENSEITFDFTYIMNGDLVSKSYTTIITADTMSKILKSGTVISGDDAQKYIDEKELIAN